MAVHSNGFTPERISTMSLDSDRNDLLAVLLSTITAEQSDTRNSEYYPDLALMVSPCGISDVSILFDFSRNPLFNTNIFFQFMKGIEQCTEYEYLTRALPPSDTAEAEETWFYRKFNGLPFRYRLTPTEDLRQLCTGKALVAGVGVDDCETQHQLNQIAGVTLSSIDTLLVDKGIIIKAEASDGGKKSANHFAKIRSEIINQGKHKDIVDLIVGHDLFSRMSEKMNEKNNVQNHDDYTMRAKLFLGLANVLRVFDFRIHPVIGTANAAAPGNYPFFHSFIF
jgi:hypothetical protein